MYYQNFHFSAPTDQTPTPPHTPHTQKSDGFSHFCHLLLTEQFNSTVTSTPTPGHALNMPRFRTTEATG